MTKTKVLWLSESMLMPSGFGQQTRLVCEGLAARDFDVTVMCSAGPKFPATMQDNLREWRFEHLYDLALVERIAEQIRPDVVVIFWCLTVNSVMLNMPTIPANTEIAIWMPWEGTSLPQGAGAISCLPKNRLVHLSNFAQKLWEPVVQSDVVIPHGVPIDEFSFISFEQRQKQKKELRKKWSKKLRFYLPEDAIILLNVDRNTHHKMWDVTLDVARRVKQSGREVILLAHTRKGVGATVEQRRMGEIGYDLQRMEKLYDLDGDICYTDFDWNRGFSRQELSELMHVCDFKISTSLGEGFGIPIIEGMATGTPQILNKTTTIPELVGDDSPWAVDSACQISRANDIWEVPDAKAMAERVLTLIESPERVSVAIERDHRRVMEEYKAERVVDAWAAYIEKLAGTDKNELWYKYRWGLRYREANVKQLIAAVALIKQIAVGKPVVEVGSFDGMFLEFCLERNVDIVGIEPDMHARAQQSGRASMFITDTDYLADWPAAFVVVCTDIWGDLLATGGNDLVDKVLEQISKYPWAILRFNASAKWGHDFDKVAAERCRIYLSDHDMTWREDLEKMTKKHFNKELTHEIWMHGNDTSQVPAGLVKGT